MLLREERDLLLEEKIENDQKGKKIAQKLEMSAKSTELDKFRLFLEEIEQITKLTVSLTIRLSRLSKRIENGTLHKEEKVSCKNIVHFSYLGYHLSAIFKEVSAFSDFSYFGLVSQSSF